MKTFLGILVALVLAVAAALALALHGQRSKARQPSASGRQPIAEMQPAVGAGGLSPVVLNAASVDPTSVRGLGTLGKPGGVEFSLFLGRNANGEECLIIASHSSRSGLTSTGLSCGADVFAGHDVAVDVRTFGGSEQAPGATYVVGLARPDVARIEVTDADGASHPMRPSAAGMFLYESDAPPTGVIAYDKGGRKIDRVALD